MNLSKNFTLLELTKSREAKANGLKNDPGPVATASLGKLAENILQPLRDALGPIHISNGYRSAVLNKLIGGAPGSQHMKGEAADIDNDGLTGPTNKQIFDFIRKNLPFDQLIHEFGTPDAPGWVHVSFASDGRQRGQVLKAVKLKGVTKYYPI